jgi:hypothetical protein
LSGSLPLIKLQIKRARGATRRTLPDVSLHCFCREPDTVHVVCMAELGMDKSVSEPIMVTMIMPRGMDIYLAIQWNYVQAANTRSSLCSLLAFVLFSARDADSE